MGLASILSLGFGLLALCSAAFNLAIAGLRRSEQGNLALGIAALGTLGASIGGALLYTSTSLGEAVAYRQFILFDISLLSLGFVRFSGYMVGKDFERWEAIWGFYTVSFVVVSFIPGVTFGGEVMRHIPWLDTHYVDAEVLPIGSILSLGYAVLSLQLLVSYIRHLDRVGPDTRLMAGACVVYFLCALNDLAVGSGLLSSMYLIGLGYGTFVVAFTWVVLRRFVASLERVEASAEELQVLVDRRTEELREKELEMAHGERMATLGTLAAGLAHEINNPLAFITSNLNQLGKSGVESCDAALEGLVDETLEGVSRIGVIVGELLGLARRSDGRNEPVDLSRVVESVLPILRYEARSRARIETSLASVPALSGDPRLLGQVVLNLVLNALHAVEEDPVNGRVRIETRNGPGRVGLVVRDTGSGIPPDVLPRIFDPFFTTKEEGRGTGLGLAMTHRLVERHRGEIHVETGPAGTRIDVWFPALAES